MLWLKRDRNQPKVRRFVTIDEPDMQTTHSLRSEQTVPYTKLPSSSNTKRKIVTIKEDEENIVMSALGT